MRQIKETRTCNMCGEVYHPRQKKKNNSCCSVKCRQKWNGIKGGKARAKQLAGTGKGLGYIKKDGRHYHRTIMERVLGRPLTKGEVVHHINGNRRDNRPENLITITQSKHVDIHRLALMKGRKCRSKTVLKTYQTKSTGE